MTHLIGKKRSSYIRKSITVMETLISWDNIIFEKSRSSAEMGMTTGWHACCASHLIFSVNSASCFQLCCTNQLVARNGIQNRFIYKLIDASFPRESKPLITTYLWWVKDTLEYECCQATDNCAGACMWISEIGLLNCQAQAGYLPATTGTGWL